MAKNDQPFIVDKLNARKGEPPNERVVQAVDFVSDDPAFAGTMTMTWQLHAVDGGTRVEIVADDVPDGISADDHAVGMASTLGGLAGYVES